MHRGPTTGKGKRRTAYQKETRPDEKQPCKQLELGQSGSRNKRKETFGVCPLSQLVLYCYRVTYEPNSILTQQLNVKSLSESET